MSLSKQFARRLDELWHRRTAMIRALVIPMGKGRLPVFSRSVRQRLTDRILDTATRLLVRREGKKQFNRIVDDRFLRHISGWGLGDRFSRLLEWAEWAEQECPGPIVYAFWKGRRCLYVGKGTTWRRLRHYDKSAYLKEATRLWVYCIHGKSNLAKAECLATHLFDPRDQKTKPAKEKWGKACPICKKHDRIRADLRALFRMR